MRRNVNQWDNQTLASCVPKYGCFRFERTELLLGRVDGQDEGEGDGGGAGGGAGAGARGWKGGGNNNI